MHLNPKDGPLSSRGRNRQFNPDDSARAPVERRSKRRVRVTKSLRRDKVGLPLESRIASRCQHVSATNLDLTLLPAAPEPGRPACFEPKLHIATALGRHAVFRSLKPSNGRLTAIGAGLPCRGPIAPMKNSPAFPKRDSGLDGTIQRTVALREARRSRSLRAWPVRTVKPMTFDASLPHLAPN